MFNKDLLLLDLEMTGTDVSKHEIIQIAAILLDKKTLKEKASFSSYVKPRRWKNRDPEAMAICKISWDEVKGAPNMKTVLSEFVEVFGKQVIPTNYGGNMDFTFLPAAFKQSKLAYPYEYHTLNIWPLCYLYMAKRKKLTNRKRFVGFTLEEVARDLKVGIPKNRHDAMADCRLEADVLRKLITKVKV